MTGLASPPSVGIPADEPAGTAAGPTFRQRWRRARTPVLVVVAVLAVAVVLALVRGGSHQGLLDPRATDAQGSRALAALLHAEGVDVVPVTTADAALRAADGDSTLLVARPRELTHDQLARLATAPSDVVLVGADDEALAAFGTGVTRVTEAPVEDRSPGCSLGAARRAGRAHTGGAVYALDAPPAGTDRCYPSDQGSSLVRVPRDGRTVTALGAQEPLTNEALDESGNAALSLGLLGGHDTLVWHHGTAVDDPDGSAEDTFWDLVPDGWKWGTLQAGIAVMLLALWRGRRLGPVVPEPLPVVIRASETVEGRARLYRRARARGHAAATLRTAARARLVSATGLDVGAPPGTLVDVVTARTGRSAGDVAGLLYGAPPGDDRALVHLADDLDALETEVRRP